MLPTVDFCGLNVSRLIIGANPFGGFSHQNKQRDAAMVSYHTPERIIETWGRAEAAGINTMITNNESPNVISAVKQYLGNGGKLKWIAQVNCKSADVMPHNIEEVVKIGCSAMYFHGWHVDNAYSEKNAGRIREWCKLAQSLGVPVGVAGHAPQAHLWVDSLDCTDFHAVCCFNCGSLHAGKGEKFQLSDLARAMSAIQKIQKPCIAYKIMGAGRIDAKMAFEYAFENIKPTDAVNVGMHRGDRDDMVEFNAGIVRELLGAEKLAPAMV
jgi:hypothetical protein